MSSVLVGGQTQGSVVDMAVDVKKYARSEKEDTSTFFTDVVNIAAIALRSQVCQTTMCQLTQA